MKRKIKFRGKTTGTNQWIYGDLVHNALGCYSRNLPIAIKQEGCYPIEVVPESVCRFVSQKDKNGVEVYEKDLVKIGGLVELVQIIDGILCSYSQEIYGEQASVNIDYEDDIRVTHSNYFEDYEIIGYRIGNKNFYNE